MKLENVLLATKQTALEYFRREYDDLKEVLSEEDLKNICQGHKNHYASFEHIKKVLESRNIQYQRVYMPYAAFEEFTGRDLVVSVGGDGTVLNTARYILDKTPLLTVKSDSKSVGALCTIRAENFEETLERILNGNFGIQNWTRAEGKFGNKTDLALNEIFVGHKYNAGASRYEISFDGASEKQMSGGVIVSTGSGSTGWYANIGGGNEKFARDCEELKFIVREFDRQADYRTVKNSIKKGQVIEIRSLMNVGGVVSFDGDTQKRMYDFGRGSKIQIRISDTPLRVVV